jgi:hypothetical protein
MNKRPGRDGGSTMALGPGLFVRDLGSEKPMDEQAKAGFFPCCGDARSASEKGPFGDFDLNCHTMAVNYGNMKADDDACVWSVRYAACVVRSRPMSGLCSYLLPGGKLRPRTE